jgi:hypothetical protein
MNVMRAKTVTELERFELWTGDVKGYEIKDGINEDEDEEEQVSQANNGSTPNVEDWGHTRFEMRTNDENGCECKYGDDADGENEEWASQANDRSMQNM